MSEKCAFGNKTIKRCALSRGGGVYKYDYPLVMYYLAGMNPKASMVFDEVN